MSVTATYLMKRLLTHSAVVVLGTGAGLAFAAVTAPAPVGAQTACENDNCSTVCSGDHCSGDCFDSPSSNRYCNMEGGTCSSGTCNET